MNATPVIVAVAATSSSNPQLGPSLWFLLMIIAMIPMIKAEMDFSLPEGKIRAYRYAYAIFGVIALAAILLITH